MSNKKKYVAYRGESKGFKYKEELFPNLCDNPIISKCTEAAESTYVDTASKEAVNDNILGGFQVKIGSNMADASLRNQLEKIKKECIAAIN